MWWSGESAELVGLNWAAAGDTGICGCQAELLEGAAQEQLCSTHDLAVIQFQAQSLSCLTCNKQTVSAVLGSNRHGRGQ